MRWLAMLALLAACSMSKQSESQSSYAQKVDTVTERGAVKITTVVEEFGPGTSALAQEGQSAPVERRQSKPEAAGSIPAGGPLPGLLRRITRVTERDPVVTHTESSVAASGEASSKSTTKVGFQLWPWLLGAGALAAAGFALWKLKPPWATAALTVLKSIFRRSN